MKQLLVSIANGNGPMADLLSAMNRAQVERHADLGLPSDELAIVTDCSGASGGIRPLPFPHFNQAIKCLNYVHGVESLGWQNEAVLLREADTWLLEPIECPVRAGEIGLVRWKYGNYNGGAIYIGPGAWSHYVRIVERLRQSDTTHDEHIYKRWAEENKEVFRRLEVAYNWDVRNPSIGGEKLMHVTRRAAQVETRVEEFLERYNIAGILGRGRQCFGNYVDGY